VSYTETDCFEAAFASDGALGYEFHEYIMSGSPYSFCKILLPPSPSAQTNCQKGFDPAAGSTTTTSGTGFPASVGRRSSSGTARCWSFES